MALEKDRSGDAIVFLEASLEEYPDAKYTYYTHYELADAYNRLGKTKPARGHSGRIRIPRLPAL